MRPVVTYGLIGLLTLLFIGGLFGPPILRTGFVRNELFGLVPAWLSGSEARPDRFDLVPIWATPLTAVVFHGGLVPLLASVLALELFGPVVERALGHVPTLLLLVLSAYVSGVIQMLSAPPHTPMLGAAGMLAGLIGAALLLRGGARMRVSIAPLGGGLTLPAAPLLIFIVLLLWRTAGEVIPRDLLTPPGLRACLAGLLCGLASAGLWRGLGAGRLAGDLLDLRPRAGAGTVVDQVRLRVFPLLLVLSVAWPTLSRLARLR